MSTSCPSRQLSHRRQLPDLRRPGRNPSPFRARPPLSSQPQPFPGLPPLCATLLMRGPGKGADCDGSRVAALVRPAALLPSGPGARSRHKRCAAQRRPNSRFRRNRRRAQSLCRTVGGCAADGGRPSPEPCLTATGVGGQREGREGREEREERAGSRRNPTGERDLAVARFSATGMTSVSHAA